MKITDDPVDVDSEEVVDGTVRAKNLREWMQEDKCFNIALAPQFNNQHSVFGLLQYFKDEGLLKHVSGIAACSGGVLPAAFIAAGSNFSNFKDNFPPEGWRGFGPSEPKITDDFHRFINNSHLPELVQDFEIPISVSLSKWGTEKAMWEDHPNVTIILANKGSTREIVTAALATGSEGGIPDSKCPHCWTGFWPKKVGLAQTVTDGAFSDLMGVEGLAALPKCDRVLHVLPLDYPHQVAPLTRQDIPGHPKELVTLIFTQPPVASHSYFIEPACNLSVPFTNIPLLCNGVVSKLFGSSGLDEKPTERWSGEWTQKMYEFTHQAAAKSVDRGWDEDVESGHKKIILPTEKLYNGLETKAERKYNLIAAARRDNWWRNFLNASKQTNSSSGAQYFDINLKRADADEQFDSDSS